jgi:D-alanyl-D-alanine carboxypeptidase
MTPKILTARNDRAEATSGPGASAIVPWWSFTKSVLATATLQLVAQGRLVLDELFAGRSFTLRQLLQHTAGLPDYGGLPEYHDAVRRRETPWDVAELMERTESDRLVFKPGEGWGYSNVGYLLVRQKIEGVAGQEIGAALRRLVLDPLDLRSVRLLATPGDLAATAWGNADGYDPRWVYHGLLAGSPDDAVRFLRLLLTGRVLPDELLAEMTKPRRLEGPSLVPGRPWETTGYGLGLMIGRMRGVGEVIGHSGGGPGSVSAVYQLRESAPPQTIAAFAPTEEIGIVEHEVARLGAA